MNISLTPGQQRRFQQMLLADNPDLAPVIDRLLPVGPAKAVSGRLTEVLVAGRASQDGTGLYGCARVRYNRVLLEDLFRNVPVTVAVYRPKSVLDLLPAITAKYGVELDPLDFDPTALTAANSGSTTLRVRNQTPRPAGHVIDSGYTLIPGSQISVAWTRPGAVALEQVLVTQTLNGFLKPSTTPNPGKANAQVISYDWHLTPDESKPEEYVADVGWLMRLTNTYPLDNASATKMASLMNKAQRDFLVESEAVVRPVNVYSGYLYQNSLGMPNPAYRKYVAVQPRSNYSSLVEGYLALRFDGLDLREWSVKKRWACRLSGYIDWIKTLTVNGAYNATLADVVNDAQGTGEGKNWGWVCVSSTNSNYNIWNSRIAYNGVPSGFPGADATLGNRVLVIEVAGTHAMPFYREILIHYYV